MTWYGNDLAWLAPFEREAKRQHGLRLNVNAGADFLIYTHSGLEVPGRPDVPVRIGFFRAPAYDTYGLAPQDYPQVDAYQGRRSNHPSGRHGLCLYFPWDPPTDRWTSDDGLAQLFNVVRDHLASDLVVWETGASWPMPEAPHGLPKGHTA